MPANSSPSRAKHQSAGSPPASWRVGDKITGSDRIGFACRASSRDCATMAARQERPIFEPRDSMENLDRHRHCRCIAHRHRQVRRHAREDPAPELGATVIRALLERRPQSGRDQRSDPRPGAHRRLRPESGAPVVDTRRPAARRSRDDDQQGVRLGPEGGDAGGERDTCGDADIVIAGGQENMSAAPHVLPGSRDGFRMGERSWSTR